MTVRLEPSRSEGGWACSPISSCFAPSAQRVARPPRSRGGEPRTPSAACRASHAQSAATPDANGPFVLVLPLVTLVALALHTRPRPARHGHPDGCNFGHLGDQVAGRHGAARRLQLQLRAGGPVGTPRFRWPKRSPLPKRDMSVFNGTARSAFFTPVLPRSVDAGATSPMKSHTNMPGSAGNTLRRAGWPRQALFQKSDGFASVPCIRRPGYQFTRQALVDMESRRTSNTADGKCAREEVPC